MKLYSLHYFRPTNVTQRFVVKIDIAWVNSKLAPLCSVVTGAIIASTKTDKNSSFSLIWFQFPLRYSMITFSPHKSWLYCTFIFVVKLLFWYTSRRNILIRIFKILCIYLSGTLKIFLKILWFSVRTRKTFAQ